MYNLTSSAKDKEHPQQFKVSWPPRDSQELLSGSSTSLKLCCQPRLGSHCSQGILYSPQPRASVAPDNLQRQPPGCEQLSSHKKKPQMFSSAIHVIIESNPHSRGTAGEKGLQLSWSRGGQCSGSHRRMQKQGGGPHTHMGAEMARAGWKQSGCSPGTLTRGNLSKFSNPLRCLKF